MSETPKTRSPQDPFHVPPERTTKPEGRWAVIQEGKNRGPANTVPVTSALRRLLETK